MGVFTLTCKGTLRGVLGASLGLALACALAPAAISTAYADNAGQNEAELLLVDSSAEVVISTAEELVAFTSGVNDGTLSTAGMTFALGGNVDLSGVNWTPIGNLDAGHAFEGTFDGRGYSITGLTIGTSADGEYADMVGLFGYSAGTVRNLTVEGSVSGNERVAGVIAYGSGVVENVTSKVNVYCAGLYAGGIVADAAGDLVVVGCHNKGEVTNGGVAQEHGEGGRFGGIVGRVDAGKTAEVTNCSNTGSITGYQYVGGIVGGAFGETTVKACCNTGNLTGISFGMTYLGGIAGKLEAGTVDSCYNTGTVNNAAWSNGHRRAIGGIVGCEIDHEQGTAVTRCYNIGTILIETSNMQSGKFVYMAGNISGGNQKTAANTMKYESCFYLEGTFPLQDESHEGYAFWSDIYKSNPLAYDTEHVTRCTSEELMGADVLAALGSSFVANPGGYPVLYWQAGAIDAPELESYALTCEVTGGTATVAIPETAEEQSLVEVRVSAIEAGKQVKQVLVTDASGASVAVEATGEAGAYAFTMPSRSAKVTVVLENVVAEDDSFALQLPADLDAIWSVTADSTYLDEVTGEVKAGATVFVTVEKNPLARTASFDGISVAAADGSSVAVTAANEKSSDGTKYHGEYSFTMPEADVAVSLNVTCADLVVSVQKGGAGAAEELATLTRADMEQLAAENGPAKYSYWETETEPTIGVAEEYVSLSQLLAAAGVTFAPGDTLVVTAIDGFSQSFTYEQLLGVDRYFYSDILSAGSAAKDAAEILPIFTVKANVTSDASTDLSSLECDTLYAYRFVYGQTPDELTSRVKVTDSMVQGMTSVTVVKGEAADGGSDDEGGEDDKDATDDSSGNIVDPADPEDGAADSDADADSKTDSSTTTKDSIAQTGDALTLAVGGFAALAAAAAACVAVARKKGLIG